MTVIYIGLGVIVLISLLITFACMDLNAELDRIEEEITRMEEENARSYEESDGEARR